jgi:hypothetical protein
MKFVWTGASVARNGNNLSRFTDGTRSSPLKVWAAVSTWKNFFIADATEDWNARRGRIEAKGEIRI